MRRSVFLAGLLTSYAAAGGIARATGGLDVGDPGVESTMRVLLQRDARSEQVTRLDAWHFLWRGRMYRGDFAFVPLDGGYMGLVNSLPLDAYLYGVLSKEVSAVWPAAAQQVQAVVSRTYALGRLRPERPYDILPGEINQVYGGMEGETLEGRAAVDATAGTILTFGQEPADIAYSACCGGHTAGSVDVWGTDFPYLRGVADPNCAGTPGYVWRQSIPLSQLQNAFGARSNRIGSIRTIELRNRDGSERPREIALRGDNGTCEMASEQFRSTLGSTRLRSTLISAANIQGDAVFIEGRGFGHGVGLCQWGSRMLAEHGASFHEIVQFYFPGTTLGRAVA